jgi:propanediol utilization protein
MNLQGLFVIDRSADHIHLTEEDAIYLFGEELNKMELRPLAIKGEFATNLKLTDDNWDKYTVLYPWRSYSQLEVSQSTFYRLFKRYDKRVNSGNLKNAPLLEVTSIDDIFTEIQIPVITVRAHIHLTDESHLSYLDDLELPFPYEIKQNETTDGMSHIHLDTDQYSAIQGDLWEMTKKSISSGH